ncbi:MAG TPA: ABC transporter permease [Acidimicrobiales bacterium]|nr:ABC transporter permease [Acidimicrobiales bacterium]
MYAFHLTSIVEGQVERAIRPETFALAVFGAIAAAAALLIGAQALRRQAWTLRDDLAVASALGADRTTLVIASSLGPLVSVVAGAALATVVAVALSPLAPIGAVRAVDPSPGLHADWTVLAVGVTMLLVVLAPFAVASGFASVRRTSGGRTEATTRRSVVSDAAARAGLPAPFVAGLRFSLERGSGRSAAPVRSALVAAVVAVVVAVATVTFASGLATLDSHPPLYGWNWSFAITSPTGSNIPPIAATELSDDPDVASWAGYSFASALFEGVTVPIIITSVHAALGPALLAGHELDGARQVVLGQQTLAQLHKKLGDTVVASYGSKKDYPIYVPPTTLRIVGVATMPAIGNSGNLHTSMGIGAEIGSDIEPKAFKAALTQPDPNLNGPTMYVVRLKPGVAASVGLSSLRRIAKDASRVMAADANAGGQSYSVIGDQRPAEIAIYQSTGSTPAVLALGLAVGAVAALGLALASSVRRRRRDLALLKTLGFRRRQLAATIAWQASTVAVVGSIFGVPLGIALGRWLWTLFAQQISAVPEPTVPVAQVVVIVAFAIVLANVVAAVPGRIAARTPAALVLRSE